MSIIPAIAKTHLANVNSGWIPSWNWSSEDCGSKLSYSCHTALDIWYSSRESGCICIQDPWLANIASIKSFQDLSISSLPHQMQPIRCFHSERSHYHLFRLLVFSLVVLWKVIKAKLDWSKIYMFSFQLNFKQSHGQLVIVSHVRVKSPF